MPLTKTAICFLGVLPRILLALEKVMPHGIAKTCNFLPPPNIFPYIILGAQDPGLHSSIGLSEALGVAADL